MKINLIALLAFLVLVLQACGNETYTKILTEKEQVSDFQWSLPARIPLPFVPLDNPMSEAKFELGRHLFYDKRLSSNASTSCSSCHFQENAFADPRPFSFGATGEELSRNSQALVNVAYNASFTWANRSLSKIEEQIMIPLFGEDPVEHGISEVNLEEVLDQIRSDDTYQELVSQAFPNDSEVSTSKIVDALASFVRGLTSFNSDFDRFERGDSTALSESAMRGRELFFSEKTECFHCHGGYNFSNSTFDASMSFIERSFHNTGLYNIANEGSFPSGNQGLYEQTGRDEDRGKFRAPSLRNIELSAPYMHDASMTSLEEVVDFYAAGGRIISEGPFAGDGRKNPNKDSFVSGFKISKQEKNDLVNFLKSLTDEDFTTNPKFSNPWNQP